MSDSRDIVKFVEAFFNFFSYFQHQMWVKTTSVEKIAFSSLPSHQQLNFQDEKFQTFLFSFLLTSVTFAKRKSRKDDKRKSACDRKSSIDIRHHPHRHNQWFYVWIELSISAGFYYSHIDVDFEGICLNCEILLLFIYIKFQCEIASCQLSIGPMVGDDERQVKMNLIFHLPKLE